MRFQQRTDWDMGKERVYYRFHILYSSHYNAMFMKFQWTSRSIEREREMCMRERALLPWCAFNNALTETRAWRGFTIDFTSYTVLIIMFMADLCYIFIYIIKWFLKSPACFRCHTKYENNFNLSMPVEQMWRKKYFWIFEKETSKSNMTVLNNSQYRALHLSKKLLVICSVFSMLINVNIPTHPILDESDMYVSNPDIFMWLQCRNVNFQSFP